jgi:hypothetical protein
MADVEFSTRKPDLEAIENLSPSNDDVLQRKAGAWTNRTLAQLTADLSIPTNLDVATASVKAGTNALAAATALDVVAIGNAAVERVTSSSYDTFIGRLAGRGAVSSTSQDNVGIGNQALESMTNAQENVAAGSTAGRSVTTGDGNIMIGFQAGDNITTGSNNVFIGKNAGHDFDLQTGSGNVFVGYAAGSFDIPNVSNTLLIDSNVTDFGALIYGEFDNRLLRINGFLTSKTKVEAKIAAYPVTAEDSGKTFTNEGTTAKRIFMLPSAAVGLNYTFIVQDSDGMTVTAGTGDTIRLAGTVSAAAGNTDSTTVGSVVRLEAINATEWIATSIIGTWVTT